MKKTINYILAAVAVFAAASCQKFETVKNIEETTAPVKTLTAVFEEGSKTTPSSENGTTYAIWAEGDVIRVMDTEGNAANHTIAAVEISDGGKKVTFDVPAEVTGEQIYAIHGDNAATTSNAGVISFTIPATQDGTFNTANICVAKADENGTLTFKNATAIIKITNGTSANCFRIESESFYCGKFKASFGLDNITVSLDQGDQKNMIKGTQYYFETNPGKTAVFDKAFNKDEAYYIAVAPGNTYTITAEKYAKNGGGKWTNFYQLTGSKQAAISKIYSLDLKNSTYTDLKAN